MALAILLDTMTLTQLLLKRKNIFPLNISFIVVHIYGITCINFIVLKANYIRENVSNRIGHSNT